MLRFEQTCSPGGGRLQLQGRLCIDEAAIARAMIIEAIDRQQAVELDLGGIEALDAAGVQLLLLAKQHATGQGRRLSLVNHSAAVVELFELYRLAGQFGDPLVLPAAPHGAVR